MSYRNELFCRLRQFSVRLRPQVYHFGCTLSQGNTLIVLTSTETTCSLWASLRDPDIQEQLLKAANLDFLPLQSSLINTEILKNGDQQSDQEV